jgi:hypothetical protein
MFTGYSGRWFKNLALSICLLLCLVLAAILPLKLLTCQPEQYSSGFRRNYLAFHTTINPVCADISQLN